MQKNMKRSKRFWILLLLLLLLLAAAVGVIRMLFFRNGDPVRLKRGETLEGYTYYSGGGMDGGGYNETIKRMEDGRALLTVSEQEWWGQDPDVCEYALDAKVLEDLEAIIRKYHMQNWNHRTFTRMLILDAGSEGYDFRFTDSSVWFSSQVYPKRYWNKLKQLHEVVDAYRESGELLPGLVVPERESDGEYYYNPSIPTEGLTELQVYQYAEDRLYYRILNGQEEMVSIGRTILLNRPDSNAKDPLFKEEDPYDLETEVEQGDVYEASITLPTRLEAGTYCLKVGEYSCEFEIR